MGQVFVSYKHDAIDIEFVNELEARLIQAEILPWTDRQLHGGIEWIRKIDLEIKASVAVIIVITPASLKSQYVTYEWSFGKGLGKTLIPILLKAPTAEDEVEIHPVLEILQHHNFTDSANANWQKLIDEILDLMGREDIPPAVTQAIKLLDSATDKDLMDGIERLKQINHPTVIPALATAMSHPTPLVRKESALLFAEKTEYKDERAIKGLETALTWPNALTRRLAINALTNLGHNLDGFKVAPYLETTIERDEDSLVAAHAIRAFGSFGSLDFAPILKNALLNHRYVYVKVAAADILAQLKDGSAIPDIASAIQAIHDQDTPSNNHRTTMVQYIASFGPVAFDTLADLLLHGESYTQIAVAEGFAHIGGQEAYDFLNKYLNDASTRRVRPYIECAIEALRHQLQKH